MTQPGMRRGMRDSAGWNALWDARRCGLECAVECAVGDARWRGLECAANGDSDTRLAVLAGGRFARVLEDRPLGRLFHVKHLFRYRTTLRQLFHVKQSQHQRWRRTKERCPLNGGGHAKLDFAAKEGLFSRSIFQTATTARPCGKAVAAFPSVVKATVEAGQVGWKACAAKRSVLVELR